jgi:DNA modification methylase
MKKTCDCGHTFEYKPEDIKFSHRVLCGDSTKREDVERLMDGKKADMVFTDPPYGLGGYGGRNNMELKGDKDNVEKFYECIPLCKENYIWGLYKNGKMLNFIPDDVIIWKKNNFGLGRGYRNQYEMCFYKGGFNKSDSDVWEVSKDTNYQHPTQKPVDLGVKAILNSSKLDNIILDIYLGSGSTLIACEKTNRVCFGAEISEVYCDVIVSRYCQFTRNNKIKLNGNEITWET